MARSAPGDTQAPLRRRVLRDGLVLFGLIATAWFYLVLGYSNWQGPSTDGLTYWAVDPADPYRGARVGELNAYLYSPAFAQVFWLIGHVPRELFIVGWTLLIVAVAVWLARPWPVALLILLLPISQDAIVGNIHVLLAAAIVAGFRWPAAWAFVLLTKVTPGVGLIWFAVRREWRNLLIALAATAAIAAVSFVIAPGPWSDWIALLRGQGPGESGRLIPRIVVAAVICAWGAFTNRPWVVPLSAMLALPVVWSDSFAMLLGCVAVSRWPREVAGRVPLRDRRLEPQAEV